MGAPTTTFTKLDAGLGDNLIADGLIWLMPKTTPLLLSKGMMRFLVGMVAGGKIPIVDFFNHAVKLADGGGEVFGEEPGEG